MTWRWLAGLMLHRPTRLLGVAAGVAVAVALLAGLGGFLSASQQTMTTRAAAGIAVDWQVAVSTGQPVNPIIAAVKVDPRTTAALPVGFVDTASLSATAGGTVQQTGAGKVLGLPASYSATFPSAIRVLVGDLSGPVVAQQTAANLHIAPGDSIRIQRPGLPAYSVTITGVVDLPQIDSLFQRIGAPAQSQPVAPPDNVVLLPAADFARAYQTVVRNRPDLVSTQIHVARNHNALANAPAKAYAEELQAANNLSARTAGAAVVGNNLGAALGGAREDAAYAQILFLFLAVPGAFLAAGLTAAVAEASAERRQREQMLLRTRGAAPTRLVALALAEAAAGGIIGVLVGLAVAWLTEPRPPLAWNVIAATAGLLVAGTVVASPAVRDARAISATGAARERERSRPVWLRYGLDVALIAAGLGIYLASGQNKFTLVLAPEGVPVVTASYWAFLGPMLAWLGLGLLSWRLADATLLRGRRVIARLLRPALGPLAPVSASLLTSNRRVVARSTVLLGLALAYAFSTATFNATYHQQAEFDAQLTNGADVTVHVAPGAHLDATFADRLSHVAGVRAVQPMLHRFAYVGSDLQDIYGVDAAHIASATTLQDSYFQRSSAAVAMSQLRTHPDGVLVSAETVNDYQLSLGDLIRLRIQNASTHRYTVVPFHYVGIVNEFPTAPKDSFLVANRAYLAAQSHNGTLETFLVNTGGRDIAAVAQRVTAIVGTSAQVSTLTNARGMVGSSLTSVDLAGLTRLELSFALILAVASGGLVIGLGLAERRRGLAVATALGATRRQTGLLGAVEPTYAVLFGVACGLLSGWAIAELTVKVLTGVFDPPPTHLAVPWMYLISVVLAAGLSVLTAAAVVIERTRRQVRDVLRSI